MTGCENIDTATIVVLLVKPRTEFDIQNSRNNFKEACQCDSITFINRSRFGYSYTWQFGSFESRTVADTLPQTVVFCDTGRFTVSLIGINPIGADTLMRRDSVWIHPLPVADFALDPDSFVIMSFSKKPLRTINLSTGGDTYRWDFGDLTDTVIAFEPTHVYKDTGRFEVTMVAVSEYGCRAKASRETWVRKGGIMRVPNAFTPAPNANTRSNRLNDYFIP